MSRRGGGAAAPPRTLALLAGAALAALALWPAAPSAPGQARAPCWREHRFLGDYPKNRDPGWHSELQGIAHDPSHWYLAQRSHVWKLPLTRDLNAQTNRPNPAQGVLRVGIRDLPSGIRPPAYNHFGDLHQARGYLFVPLENVDDTSRTPRVAIFRASTLRFVGAPRLQQFKAPWVALRREGGRLVLYSSNFVITAGQPLFRYVVEFDRRTGRPRLRRTLRRPFVLKDEAGRPLAVDGVQGGVFSGQGCLYVVSLDERGGIHLFNRAGRRVAHSRNGSGPFNYEWHPGDREEPEGIDWFPVDARNLPGRVDGELHAILLDNDALSADDIYVKHYDVRP